MSKYLSRGRYAKQNIWKNPLIYEKKKKKKKKKKNVKKTFKKLE